MYCEINKFAIQSYNEIHGTNFDACDIKEISANDLNICDTDKYRYLLTYSFPCQDLSTAGKQSGMTENSGTRSSLLWEVKRLLSECANLPQYLLMENVSQVLGAKNINDFQKWCGFLNSLGYTNYCQCLNAKDYGIPQNRNRCFMISILNTENKYFKFPEKIPLKIGVKDLLETDNTPRLRLLPQWQAPYTLPSYP